MDNKYTCFIFCVPCWLLTSPPTYPYPQFLFVRATKLKSPILARILNIVQCLIFSDVLRPIQCLPLQ